MDPESQINFKNINTFEISTNIDPMSTQNNSKILCVPYNKYGNCFILFPSYSNHNNTPFFVIGPNAFLYPVLVNIILAMAVVLYKILISNSAVPWAQGIFILLVGCILFVYSLTVLINPGVVMNTTNSIDYTKQCYHCNTFSNENSNTRHCSICNVCIEGYDHHCVWIGKCVGKGNKFLFYLMITFIVICYAYAILLTILKYK